MRVHEYEDIIAISGKVDLEEVIKKLSVTLVGILSTNPFLRSGQEAYDIYIDSFSGYSIRKLAMTYHMSRYHIRRVCATVSSAIAVLIDWKPELPSEKYPHF